MQDVSGTCSSTYVTYVTVYCSIATQKLPNISFTRRRNDTFDVWWDILMSIFITNLLPSRLTVKEF